MFSTYLCLFKEHVLSCAIQGPSHNPGINQRALSELFKVVEERQEDWDYSIVVSVLEIYNESVHDLLSVNNAERLEIKQGPDGIFVPGLIQVQVSSFHDVNEVSNCIGALPDLSSKKIKWQNWVGS